MTTASRNYRQPREIRQDVPDLAHWAHSRETHIAVACAIHAIHAIAGTRRSAEMIWEEPTDAEYDHVKMAVAEYVAAGDFDACDTFLWGAETLRLSA